VNDSETSAATSGASPSSTPETALASGGWRGDEHKLQVSAASEAGLEADSVEVDLYAQAFRAGMTIDDPHDGAIVVRGRTVLRDNELRDALKPLLHYLRVPYDALRVWVHDGSFEVRISRRAAEAGRPAVENAKITLKLWFGFGLLGLTVLLWSPFFAQAGAALLWGTGLILGGWQLRHGLASGRAMLAARLALGLGMLAREQQLILPPAGDGEAGS
jgi:hypothetical protein